MSCQKAASLISAYLDRELTGREMLALRDHMEECDACRREMNQTRELKRLLATLPDIDPPAGFEERLRQNVLGRRPAKAAAWRAATIAVASMGAVAAAYVLILGQIPHTAGGVEEAVPQRFSVRDDQAFAAGADPFGGHVPVITASY